MVPTTSNMTLADLAAQSLAAVRTLEKHGLDYCCGGRQRFDEACRAKGLQPEAVMEEIDRATRSQAPARDWLTAPIDELANHILATHHEYLKREMPVLGARLGKVLAAHGERDPQTLRRMAAVYGALRDELDMHMHKEEVILFPFIGQYAEAAAQGRPVPPVPFGSIAHPIAMMEQEHDSAGDALAELRRLTNGYQLPEYACSTVAALYEGLQALEADLHAHIHLENNILFPRAIALEER